MINNKAKNVYIKKFDTISDFNDWKDKFPLYIIYDIQIKNAIYVIYNKVNYN